MMSVMLNWECYFSGWDFVGFNLFGGVFLLG